MDSYFLLMKADVDALKKDIDVIVEILEKRVRTQVEKYGASPKMVEDKVKEIEVIKKFSNLSTATIDYAKERFDNDNSYHEGLRKGMSLGHRNAVDTGEWDRARLFRTNRENETFRQQSILKAMKDMPDLF